MLYRVCLEGGDWVGGMAGAASLFQRLSCWATLEQQDQGQGQEAVVQCLTSLSSLVSQMGRYAQYGSGGLSLVQAWTTLSLARSLLDASLSWSLPEKGREVYLLGVASLLPALAVEYADLSTARRLFSQSLFSDSSSSYLSYTSYLHRGRTRRTKGRKGVVGVSYASQRTAAAQTLVSLASLAGLPLHLIGLDRPYTHFGDKIRGYAAFFTQTDDGPVGDDEDDVVLLDAYDVLVFPAIRYLPQIRRRLSSTPLWACAEHGIYPELAGKLPGNLEVSRYLGI